ncbi:MAG: hypothetical protein H6579_04995 [Chitinophagales bacterium]|nr:hypothetical protein [Chitinophagales bacterium]
MSLFLKRNIANSFPTIITISFLLIVLCPFAILSIFAVPNLEDYAESIIPEVWWHLKFLYLTYDGRFFTSFLFAAANPLKIESYILYSCIPIVLIGLVYFSFFRFFISFLTKSKKYALAYSSLLFIFFLVRNPNIPYTFYYMISSYVYLVPSICFLFLLSYSFEMLKGKDSPLYPLSISILMIFCIAGGNELLLIPSLVWFFILLTLNKSYNYNKGKELMVVFIAIVCAYFLVFSSPGVANALAENKEVNPLAYGINALLKSASFMSYNIFQWLSGNLSLLFGSIAVFLLMHTDKDLVHYKLNFPKKIGILIFMILSLLLFIFPYTWAVGTKAKISYTQVQIIPYLFFVIYLMLLISILPKKFPFKLNTKTLSLFFTCFMYLALFLDKNSTVRTAYIDLFSQEAFLYHSEVMENIEKSKNAQAGGVVTICNLKHPARSLFSGVYFNELNEDFHLQYRLYYGLKEIKVSTCQ